MPLEDFMVDYHTDKEIVYVKAKQLHDIMKMFYDYESVIKKQEKIIEQNNNCIDFLRGQLDDFKNGKMFIDLRV